jgi:transglutaminase superfamily protein
MNGPLSPAWRLRATTAALLFPPLVYLVSLKRLTAWVERRSAANAGPVWDVALAEWVDRVLRRLPPPWRHTCLKRALTLQYLIRRAGRQVQLKVGVRRNAAGELLAHAWLVRDGELYLEPGTEHAESFQVLASFPD